MRPSATDFTTALMSMPTANLSRGWSMRETEIESMGSRATTPQPMSANAPKFSRCVMRASIISPGINLDILPSMHFSWAALLESMAVTLPSGCFSNPVTIKHTGLLTREMMAMSRTVPSRIPTAHSSRGIKPLVHPRSTIRLWALSQTSARPSRILPSRQASLSEEKFAVAAWFSRVSILQPSG